MPDLEGTVVGAVPRADAAVVHHVVQPFRDCAWWPPPDKRFRTERSRTACTAAAARTARGSSSRTDVIPIHADPVHLAAAQHLIFADDGNVVLRLAGHHAGVAARARAQIDRHAPLIALIVGELVIDRVQRRNLLHLLDDLRVLLVILNGDFAEDRTALADARRLRRCRRWFRAPAWSKAGRCRSAGCQCWPARNPGHTRTRPWCESDWRYSRRLCRRVRSARGRSPS